MIIYLRARTIYMEINFSQIGSNSQCSVSIIVSCLQYQLLDSFFEDISILTLLLSDEKSANFDQVDHLSPLVQTESMN